MMLATKILMKASCAYSNNVQEIDQIYVDGCNNPGFFKKELLHDYVKAHPKSIQVNIRPFPYLVARTSKNGEKYVASEPNDTPNDNLLKLLRY